MKLSYFSYIGYGLMIATIYGISKYSLADYRVMGLFILCICFLIRDPLKEIVERKKKK